MRRQDVRIETPREGRRFAGAYTVPGDKSITHRALLLAALAPGRSTIRSPLRCRSTSATEEIVRQLGAEVYFWDGMTDPDDPDPDVVTVIGRGLALSEPSGALYCAGSGTTARLLLGVLAGQDGGRTAVLTGTPELCSRPMGRVTRPLSRMGATFLGRADATALPLAVRGHANLEGGEFTVASAQVKSALLLAGLFARSPVEVVDLGTSRDHTERMLRLAGCPVEVSTSGSVTVSTVRSVESLRPFDLRVPGDLSSAAFLLAAAILVPGGEVLVDDVGLNPTRTGFLEVARRMGALVEVSPSLPVVGTGSTGKVLTRDRRPDEEPVGSVAARHLGPLSATEVSARELPTLLDEVPILALLATQARGTTVFRGVGDLRAKESNRVEALRGLLEKFGAIVRVRGDDLEVDGPTRLRGAVVETHGDHRLAMTACVAGLIAAETTYVRGGARVVEDSFPDFVHALTWLSSAGELGRPVGISEE